MPMGGEEILSQTYKYMFEKVRDAADVLDETITTLADQMISQLKTEEYSDLRVASNVSRCVEVCFYTTSYYYFLFTIYYQYYYCYCHCHCHCYLLFTTATSTIIMFPLSQLDPLLIF